ncbi:MAG: hypothetical protein QF830_07525 [Rhodospirillales bacterium]|nr:hypothetical protein [Rhodospirillales bacterium]MDP6883969.1 hypothetical protein [Rhodospirillales bacterium]
MPSADYRKPGRSLLDGLTRGMAGAAALVVPTAAGVNSAPLGFGDIVLFGVGSVPGRAILSAVIALPLACAAFWRLKGNHGRRARGAVPIDVP